MRKERLMGISAMYNFRADPDLGIGKTAIRRTLSACDSCLDQLSSVWKERTVDEEQPRYKTCFKFELNNILNVLMSGE